MRPFENNLTTEPQVRSKQWKMHLKQQFLAKGMSVDIVFAGPPDMVALPKEPISKTEEEFSTAQSTTLDQNSVTNSSGTFG